MMMEASSSWRLTMERDLELSLVARNPEDKLVFIDAS